jgi:hypothetical protein
MPPWGPDLENKIIQFYSITRLLMVFTKVYLRLNRTGGIWLTCWPIERYIVGSDPGRIKPKTIKFVFVVSLISTQL